MREVKNARSFLKKRIQTSNYQLYRLSSGIVRSKNYSVSILDFQFQIFRYRLVIDKNYYRFIKNLIISIVNHSPKAWISLRHPSKKIFQIFSLFNAFCKCNLTVLPKSYTEPRRYLKIDYVVYDLSRHQEYMGVNTCVSLPSTSFF